ncbi:armadillo repeat containing 3-like protein [Camelus ferus]|nr:armadillo repeat containing 3-like protein [Camelus ferus]
MLIVQYLFFLVKCIREPSTFDPLTIESKNAATVMLLLNSPEEEVLADVCEAIYRFALKGDIKKLLRELDVMSSVIAQLAPEEEVVTHEFASLCLANMSVEYMGKVQIFEQGGLEPLIRLLTSPDPDVKKNSIECIYNLVQELNDLHMEALSVMANCLEDKETMVLIQETVLKKLLSFAENSTNPDIQKNAAKAVTKAACDPENRKLFHEQEVEKCLITLLESENDGTKIAASQAISAMSENSSSKQFFNNQGIPQLIQLLKSDNEEVREAAALALANLTTCNHANANAAAKADGIEALINTLSSGRNKVVANAATVLMNMATQEPLRLSIQTHDIMHALRGPLCSANKVVQSKATLAIAAIACDAKARTELRNSGGLEPLVELLRSKNNEVRNHASWAVMVCASDEPTATELCRLGALDILEEIDLSVSRKNKFSEVAYNKLLNHHLSLKYSKTGYLSSSNIINDGFYDCGRALADKIGIGCSLVRGEYGRAWNEVQLMNEPQKGLTGAFSPPEFYIVDLMFHPGALMKLRSQEADLYRFL